MGDIERAIEEFKQRLLNVYKSDPQRIVRDTCGAERAAKDHTGRWLLEILQNSDDAHATEVKIIVMDDAIYVADNGKGFKPEAVSSICGTDYSDKASGTIGRKGVGFKSVYDISSHPQLLTVGGEGVEFIPERAREWLRQNGFDRGHVPYQWIPFLISWDEARRQDSVLAELKDYKTIIRLSGLSDEKKQSVEQLLKEWPPHPLFTFRFVRKLKAPNMEVVVTPGDGIWQIEDSRGQIPRFWFVAKPDSEYPPEELLGTLGEEDRKAIQTDGVSFLIAAPCIEERITPTKGYLPVHVFYPTEQKGPVRLLLHAEFLVKSDRTALIPIEKGSFNEWVADRLAHHVCIFVNNAFRPKNPSGHAALIVPFDGRGSHPVADKIWRLISDKAKADLRLASIEGKQRLAVGKAKLISVSVRPDLARTLLESIKLRRQLLHREFDGDEEARKAIKELGCKEIRDQDLMDILAENAASRTSDTQWIWSCWEWLADWVAKEPYGDKHNERVARAKLLPIVPVGGRLCKPAELETHIVTWKPEGHVEHLPNWLPLTFVDDWFRDQIQPMTEKDDSVMKLCAELAIKEPGADVIQRALGQAIMQYWKDKQGDPGRFLSFIIEQDWYETSELSVKLKRCPVPLSHPMQDEGWAEAGKAYFGREWGDDLIADLYDGIDGIAWVRYEDGEDSPDKRRRVFEWLGVAACPRIVVFKKPDPMNIWGLPTDCNDWKEYLNTARDTLGRWVSRIRDISKIDHLDLGSLNSKRALLLARLIAKHWDYYCEKAETTAEGTLSREQYYRSWKVKAKWWWEVCEQIQLPRRDRGAEHVALTALWVIDKRTERVMGDLLPVIDLDSFGDDKNTVRKWLVGAAGLRTRIEQLAVEEWKELLTKRIPEVAPAQHLITNKQLRDKVIGWYTACLDNVADGNVSEGVFADSPLLCRKGSEWKYVGTGEPRYLDDDNDCARAFAEDVWLFHAPTRLAADTMKYFSVNSLSKSMNIDVLPGGSESPLSGELCVRFNESLPYVYAWRSSQNRQDAETLSAKLRKLQVLVVSSLKAHLSLNGLCRKVERQCDVKDGTIYLLSEQANEAALALALSRLVGVPSEADFYENLIRCSNDNQRNGKLLSKGIAEAEVERCLREYQGFPDDVGPEQAITEMTKRDIAPASPQQSQPENKAQQHKTATDKSQNMTAEKPQEQQAVVDDRPLRLKDYLTVDYVIGEPPQRGFEAGGGGGGGGGGGNQEGHQLTEEEKIALEKAGRGLAARELEKLGYVVERMPSGNPGFDLRAMRDDRELRVEVKAHAGRATVVDVTQREYKEYLGQQGYIWELWNVEHLSKNDAEPVTITRYDHIPDDALDARSFRVDLKKCQAHSNLSSTAE